MFNPIKGTEKVEEDEEMTEKNRNADTVPEDQGTDEPTVDVEEMTKKAEKGGQCSF